MDISFSNQQRYTSFCSDVYMTPDVVELANTVSKTDQESMMQGIEELECNGNEDVVLLSNYNNSLPRSFKMTCFEYDNGKLKKYDSSENVGPSYKSIVDAYAKVKRHDCLPVKEGKFDGYSILDCVM